ncbi:MAG: lytic murein transglycosylase B, partial [Candidatus Competibacteraceae bacterium]|nr:lytic murein transglycosylase B [Candidatus Competibacteraceae bacterium]
LIAALALPACASTNPLAGGAPQPAPQVVATAPPQQGTDLEDNESLPVAANSLAQRPEVQAFIREMARRHGFSAEALREIFSRAQAQPSIIAAITRPAEAKPWYAYRRIFLTPTRIDRGVAFWSRHREALERARAEFGVHPEVIVAIIGVETLYGGNTGSYRVLEALSTLAFDYPRRADFFRKELEEYLLMTREEGIDPLALKGSYAGAMGLGQFIPSSYRAYAVDFDGDGHRDLWNNPVDAIGSVANYLARHRWQRGEPIATPARVSGSAWQPLVMDRLAPPERDVSTLVQAGVDPLGQINGQRDAILLELEGETGPEYWLGFNNFYAITRYNHSPLYAMAVYQLGQEILQARGN